MSDNAEVPADEVPILRSRLEAELNPPLRGRVLVAEGHLGLRQLFRYALGRAGLEVHLAENGSVAFQRAMAADEVGQPYQLILMDMHMPVVDGYEACRRLRTAGWQGPIVAVTASTTPNDLQKCLEAGCTDHLAKPVHHEQLLATVARHLHLAEIAASGPAKPGDETKTSLLESGLLYPAEKLRLQQLFLQDTLEQASRLERLFHDRDHGGIADMAHRIRGAAAMFGYRQIAEAFAELQRLADSDPTEDSLRTAIAAVTRLVRATATEGPGPFRQE